MEKKSTKSPPEEQIAALEKQLAAARHDEALSRTEGALIGRVKPACVPAVALLLQSRGAIARDEGGNVVFRTGGVDLPLTAGIAMWTKTNEAAPFLPSPRVPAGRERDRSEFFDDLRRSTDGATFTLGTRR